MPGAPIALTCGEPSGVGPELAVKARALLGADLPFFWIGDPRHLPSGTAVAEIARPEDARAVPANHLPVLPHPFPEPASPGQPAPANAAATIAVIERAVALVQSGAASALCTAPIHKKALKDGAGFAFPGHTEFLAHLAGVDQVVMMLACDQLRT
ncbi:MAG: 4-hydroxythreonine-4-phosphate dehydrogenase PdxA, partial [Rhodobacteraceae bacterium]|nr:4-hydroxythreonine-4-phosphate dehydrogenase PdxA [Paracoccaceae bacterium]